MWGEITPEEAREALDRCAEEILWECGITQGPVDAVLVAMRLGLSVAQDQNLPGRAALVRLQQESGDHPTAVVLLGEAERYERQQFSVAHEVGEFAAPRLFERLGITPYDVPTAGREKVANLLAGHLLVPSAWLKQGAQECDWDLMELKQRFSTASHELIARRMLDMPPPVVVTLFDHGQVTWRRTNRRFSPGALLAPERQTWQDSHDLGVRTQQQADSPSGQLRIDCWSVHEPGWKREIMRTEILAWE